MNKCYQGWLVKSPPEWRTHLKFIRPKWRKRYFVLYSPPNSCLTPGVCHAVLSYYNNENLTTEYGKIDLSTCEEMTSKLKSESNSFVFSIKTISKNKKRVYYLAADNDEELNRWTREIGHILSLSKGFIEQNAKPNGALKSSQSGLYTNPKQVFPSLKRAITDIGNKFPKKNYNANPFMSVHSPSDNSDDVDESNNQRNSKFYWSKSKDRTSKVQNNHTETVPRENSLFIQSRKQSCPSLFSTLSRGTSLVALSFDSYVPIPSTAVEFSSEASDGVYCSHGALLEDSAEKDNEITKPGKELNANDIFRISEYTDEDEIPTLPQKKNSTIETRQESFCYDANQTIPNAGRLTKIESESDYDIVPIKGELSPQRVIEKERNDSSESIYDVPLIRFSNSSNKMYDSQTDLSQGFEPPVVTERTDSQEEKEDYDYLPCHGNKTHNKNSIMINSTSFIVSSRENPLEFAYGKMQLNHSASSSLEPDYDYLPTNKNLSPKPFLCTPSDKTKFKHTYGKEESVFNSAEKLKKSSSVQVKHTSYSSGVPMKQKHISKFLRNLSESSDGISEIVNKDEVVYDLLLPRRPICTKIDVRPAVMPKPKLEFVRYDVDATNFIHCSVYKIVTRSADFLSSKEIKRQSGSEDLEESTVRLTSHSKSFKKKDNLNLSAN